MHGTTKPFNRHPLTLHALGYTKGKSGQSWEDTAWKMKKNDLEVRELV